MATNSPHPELSRRRLLQAAGAAGLGLALGGLGPVAQVARAQSPISFGVRPFDRALDMLGENGYSLRSAGLAVNDQGSILIDGTERSRRELYRYADRVGPYIDHLGDLALARSVGWDHGYERLLGVRENTHVYTAPLPSGRYQALRRTFRAHERFGFGLLPNHEHHPHWGRPWPLPGDFWGLAFVVDRHQTPFIWLIVSTAEYRAISPWGATRAVRTEVVVQQANGDAQWLGYPGGEPLLCCILHRNGHDFFNFPHFG